MSTEQIPITDTPFVIAGRTLRSRLILGTGGVRSCLLYTSDAADEL